MVAGGAQSGSLGANHDVTAVAALPNLDLALGEDSLGLNVLRSEEHTSELQSR